MDDQREDAYKRPYFHAFNAMTDAIRAIEAHDYGTALDILIKAQQQAEEMYIAADE